MSNSITDMVYRSVSVQFEKADADSGEMTHVISTDSTDRQGDVVEPGGAQLASYQKNPVVLVDHMATAGTIIGEAKSIEVKSDRLVATTKFLDTALARDAMRLATAGLGGWSIGFRGLNVESIRDDKDRFTGLRFKEWELLEYSFVAIPANQDAVNRCMKQFGISPESINTLFHVEQEGLRITADPEPEVKVSFDLDEYVRRSASQLIRTDAAIAGAKLRGLIRS